MAVKGPNHQMRTRIRGLTVLFALIGFGLVGVRLLYMQVFNHDFYVQQATALQTRDTFITARSTTRTCRFWLSPPQ